MLFCRDKNAQSNETGQFNLEIRCLLSVNGFFKRTVSKKSETMFYILLLSLGNLVRAACDFV